MSKTNEFDCIVIGGGHAGVEAAHAAATIGAKICLITISKDTIAKMSCNPAIGGLGKGQIAREVDGIGDRCDGNSISPAEPLEGPGCPCPEGSNRQIQI